MWIENRNSYRKRQVTCAILGVCASLLFVMAVLNRQEVVAAKNLSNAQIELADEVLRFHVLANSDSDEDQELKLKVRDAILSYIRGSLSGEEELGDVKIWVRNHLDDIKQIAYEALCAEGYDYSVSARVMKCYFPDRRYGGMLFPKGYYEALRVEIGAASGHNWWCVLYPSLCFVDATCAVVTEEGEQELSGVLSEESYESVSVTSGNFKIKSFFYELLRGETE